MTRFVRTTLLFWAGISATSGLAAEPCSKPYLKSIPWSRRIFDDKVQLSVSNEARFTFDCETFLAENTGRLSLGYYRLNLDVLTVKASAHQRSKDTEVGFRTLLLGYELAQDRRILSEIYDRSFGQDQEMDIHDETIVQVGPVPVPVRYGVEGKGEVRVRAGLKGVGAQLALVPKAKVNAYVQAGADIQIITAAAQGKLTLVDGEVVNTLAVSHKTKGDDTGIFFMAQSTADLMTLEGSVTAKVEAKMGDKKQSHEQELFRWEGQSLTGSLFEFSDKIASLPQ